MFMLYFRLTVTSNLCLFLISFLTKGTYSKRDNVLCPGNEKSCDCSPYMCYYLSDSYCSCEEAQKCCEEAHDPAHNVICPENEDTDYCDCSAWMCTSIDQGPMYCGCDEAQTSDCCGDFTMSPTDSPPEGYVKCEGSHYLQYCDCSLRMCNDPYFLSDFCFCEEAQKCCEGKTYSPTDSPPEGSVVCEGYDEFQYCDCSQYMCTNEYHMNRRCGCEEAQKCCEGFTASPTPVLPEGAVLCEDNSYSMYCDCTEWGCIHSEYRDIFCYCEEAQKCCEDVTFSPTPGPPEGTVLCEGNDPSWEYCECSYSECTDPELRDLYCGCEEAQKCCEGVTASPTPVLPEGTVLCEGKKYWQYCRCSLSYCTDPDLRDLYCGCEEAQKCCEGVTAPPTSTASPTPVLPEGAVLCEGNDPSWQYCECSYSECTVPELREFFCGCEKGQKCCEGFTFWPTWAWVDEEEGDALNDEIKVKKLR